MSKPRIKPKPPSRAGFDTRERGERADMEDSLRIIGKQLFRIGRDALIGASLLPFYENPTAHNIFLAELRKHRRLSNYELTLQDQEGRSHKMLINASLRSEAAEPGEKVIGSIRDITDRRQLEEHLAQAQQMESLEQVLINLLVNARDAIKAASINKLYN